MVCVAVDALDSFKSSVSQTIGLLAGWSRLTLELRALGTADPHTSK